jgi:large subunit ribosomal protein L22
MEGKAINKYIPSSPRKMRLVVDLIRNVSVDHALEILHFQSKHAARDVEKTVRSAVANLLNEEGTARVETHDLVVKEAYVDQGPSLKRIMPAPMGRAYRIKKRSCHVTIVVATKE